MNYRDYATTPRIAALAAGLILALATGTVSVAAAVSVRDLAKRTHFHGIAVDARDSGRIYLATHHGFYVIDVQGRASRISADTNDYMGFTPHPADPGVLFASGHPANGGNMGFLTSHDDGKTWHQLSSGAHGPVDFHQMDVSKADPKLAFGVFKGLQVSRDGGRTWRLAGNLPQGVIDLAASATDAARVYAATGSGLQYSTDTANTWQPALLRQAPASLVQTGHNGELYAFIVGMGLIRTREPALDWEVVNNDFGERFLLHLAVDPGDPRRLYAVTNQQQVLTSGDGGSTWTGLGETGRE